MKEIKDDIKKWWDIPCSWVGRINTVKITILPNAIYIQCDPYQITMGIFHRTRTKHFTIHLETRNTPNCQSSLEKEKWSWRNQSSWLQMILQSYCHQDSMEWVQKQKYRPIEQDREPRDKSTHLWVPYFWQREEYTMGKRELLNWCWEN